MPRIRYLAMLCADPAGLAGFYRDCFGLEEMGRTDAGDLTLTDGGFNITLFKQRPQLHEPRMERGLHHLGIAVESLEETLARYRAFNARGVIIPESGDLQHGELRIHDPECHPVSLSQRHFGLDGAGGAIPRRLLVGECRRAHGIQPTGAHHPMIWRSTLLASGITDS